MSITPGYRAKKKFIMVAVRRDSDTIGSDYIEDGAQPVAIQTDGLAVEPLITEQVERNIDNGENGGNPVIHINAMIKITAPFELTGSGTASDPTAFASLLQVSGRDVNTDAGTEVSYNRIKQASAERDGTIYFYWEGMYHKALACKASLSRSGSVSERLMCTAEITGVYGGTIDGAPPVPDFGAFQTPLPMGEQHTSFSIDGQVLNLFQYEMSDNATIEYDEGTEQKRIFIDDWSEEGKFIIESPTLSTFDPFALQLSNVFVPYNFQHGQVANQIWQEGSSAIQILTVKPAEQKGKQCWELTCKVIKGNDAVLTSK